MLFSQIEPVELPDPWPGRIIGADVSALISIGGAGKGLCTCDIAARISRGWVMPPLLPDDPTIDWETVDLPGYVIMIGLEDRADTTVIRRLTAAGADLSKVDDMSHVQRARAGNGSGRSRFSINDDLGALRRRIEELGDVRLVVIDPLFSAARTTVSFNQTLRTQIIEPLQELAADTGVAILLVHHFTKGTQKRSPNATFDLADYVGGSKGLVDALRMLTVVTDDPTNPQVKVMQNLKTNEGAKGEADRYIIVANGPKDPDAHIEWEQPVPDLTSDAAMFRLQQRIVRELEAAAAPMTAQQIATAYRLSYSVVTRLLKQMEHGGLIRKTRGAFIAADRPEIAPVRPDLRTAGQLLAARRWER